MSSTTLPAAGIFTAAELRNFAWMGGTAHMPPQALLHLAQEMDDMKMETSLCILDPQRYFAR